MNNGYKIIFITVSVVISVSFYSIAKTNYSISAQLQQQKLSIIQLKNKLKLLDDENLALNVKLNTQISENFAALNDQTQIQSNQQNTNELKSLETGSEIINTSKAIVETASSDTNTEMNQDVDINAPLNGVDPRSQEQQTKYLAFKDVIESYDYNERFDMQGFLSDPRLSELHASLGVKILDYVDVQLKDIVLMQDMADSAELLNEIEH